MRLGYHTCFHTLYNEKKKKKNWTPSHGQVKAGRPAYIQQLCEDMGYSPEDLPKAMNDRERWQERVRDIHADGMTRWWWWWWWWRMIKFCYLVEKTKKNKKKFLNNSLCILSNERNVFWAYKISFQMNKYKSIYIDIQSSVLKSLFKFELNHLFYAYELP